MSLPLVNYSRGIAPGVECQTCLETYTEEDPPLAHPPDEEGQALHLAHTSCWKMWANKQKEQGALPCLSGCGKSVDTSTLFSEKEKAALIGKKFFKNAFIAGLSSLICIELSKMNAAAAVMLGLTTALTLTARSDRTYNQLAHTAFGAAIAAETLAEQQGSGLVLAAGAGSLAALITVVAGGLLGRAENTGSNLSRRISTGMNGALIVAAYKVNFSATVSFQVAGLGATLIMMKMKACAKSVLKGVLISQIAYPILGSSTPLTTTLAALSAGLFSLSNKAI